MGFKKVKFSIQKWPEKPGVYLMVNAKGVVIYIGKAKKLKSRIRSYFSSTMSLKTKFLTKQIASLDYMTTNTEDEALLLEASLIKKHKPRYNVRLKDDKAYPYIRVSMKDTFPRFYLERRVKKDGSLYFGPYVESHKVRNIIRFLNETFQIRDCSNGFMRGRKRPCLTHQMGFCTAPCVSDVTAEDYGVQIGQALSFLKSRESQLVLQLEKEMKEKARTEEFEQALVIKNRIESIKKIQENQIVLDRKHLKDVDVFAHYRDSDCVQFEFLHIRTGRLIGHFSHFEKEAWWQHEKKNFEDSTLTFLSQYYMENLIPSGVILPLGFSSSFIRRLERFLKSISGRNVLVSVEKRNNEKKWILMAEQNAKDHFSVIFKKEQSVKKSLLEIQKKFHLSQIPERMECYDISHFQSQAIYASQVVFENGVKNPKEYRIYKLKEKNDDYFAMKTVLSRRLVKKEYPLPQMILVDGGKGQLQIAYQVLKELDLSIPVVSIAKSKEKVISKRGFSTEKFYLPLRKNPVLFSPYQLSYKILVQMRDEAHRFALHHHRKKLRSSLLSSDLNFIKGVGQKRKEALLKKFRNIQQIKKSTPQELSKIDGVGLQLANNILKQLQQIS